MKPWTISGVCLVTLTLVSLWSSAQGAERELIPTRARVTRQAGNQFVVDGRSASSNENVRFVRQPQASGAAVQQHQGDQVTFFRADPSSSQQGSTSTGQQVQLSGLDNPHSGQHIRTRRQGQVSSSQRPLLDYPDDLPLTQMTPEMLNNFLTSEEDVVILTNCFESFRTCQSKHGINLIKQLRELGIGGRCKDCSPQEQERLDELIYEFIQNFISRYPTYWRRIVPNIGKFLVPRRPDA